MTVFELIEQLQRMPPDLTVGRWTIKWYGSDDVDSFEVVTSVGLGNGEYTGSGEPPKVVLLEMEER